MDGSLPVSLSELVDPATTALVVWDMQAGLGGRAHNLGTLETTLAGLLAAARKRGVPVIFSQHVAPRLEDTPAPQIRAMMRRQKVSDPKDVRAALQAGTPEVAFLPSFQPRVGELVIEKTTPSFFIGTPFALRLRARGIRTLVLGGVATEQGIEFTARHATALGYFVVIAEDAVGSFTAEAHEAGLSFLRTAVDVTSSAAIQEAWSS